MVWLIENLSQSILPGPAELFAQCFTESFAVEFKANLNCKKS